MRERILAPACEVSLDCNSNGTPDECELTGNDCNANGLPDDCDITAGTSLDCNSNGILDECEGPPCTGILGGDMDCSGTVTMADLPDFVDSLLAGVFTCNADANGDFVVNGLDAAAFVDLVLP